MPPAVCATIYAPSFACAPKPIKQRPAPTNQITALGGAIAMKRLQALHDAACRQFTAIETGTRESINRDQATAETVAIINARILKTPTAKPTQKKLS